MRTSLLLAAACLALLGAACSSDDTSDAPTVASAASVEEPPAATSPEAPAATGATSTFTAEVWADNWFSLYVNGEPVGEDSVPIATERSFNAETISFEATYPLIVAMEAKDFKETDSGIEYIGQPNQQLGDGGVIAQITDQSSGEVVAVTDSDWKALVVHRAPLNRACEKDANPDATCRSEIIDPPAGWTAADFDDSTWTAATPWTEADVRPKDGYDQVSWDPSAQLIWGSDLEVDNTVLLRSTVEG